MTELELNTFYSEITAYVAKLKDRRPEDFRMETAIGQMGQMDSMMANLSMAVGGIAAISLIVGGIGRARSASAKRWEPARGTS